jgi:large subunit ribosomal protein L13
MNTNYTIDAEGKTLGRVASEVAKSLMGKKLPDYVSNKVSNVKVTVINVSKTKTSPIKLEKTLHEKYSGQPGGFKLMSNQEIIDKKGWKNLYELAIYGMLPNNKLRPKMMKNLEIKD